MGRPLDKIRNSRSKSTLIGISGIDNSGKERLPGELRLDHDVVAHALLMQLLAPLAQPSLLLLLLGPLPLLAAHRVGAAVYCRRGKRGTSVRKKCRTTVQSSGTSMCGMGSCSASLK